MAYHDKVSVLCQKLVDVLDSKKAELGLREVYYGDQELIPYTPAVCVEPGGKDRSGPTPTRVVESEVTAYVFIYNFEMSNTEQLRKANDELSELVEAEIDARGAQENGLPALGGFIHAYVNASESGYVIRRGSLLRATRLTVTARTKFQLPGT